MYTHLLIIPNCRRGVLIPACMSNYFLPSTSLINLCSKRVETQQQIPVVIVLARHPGCRVGVNTVTPAFSKPNALETKATIHPMHSELRYKRWHILADCCKQRDTTGIRQPAIHACVPWGYQRLHTPTTAKQAAPTLGDTSLARSQSTGRQYGLPSLPRVQQYCKASKWLFRQNIGQELTIG